MVPTPSVVRAVSAWAIGLVVSCEGEPSPVAKAEPELPPPAAEPDPEPTIEPALPEPAPPTLERLVEGIDIAWYGPKHEGELMLLCDYTFFEQRGKLEERTPCTTIVDTAHVVDAHGNAPWKVVERHRRLWLTREGATFPTSSAPALALFDAPVKDARLSFPSTSPPTKRPKSVTRAVTEAIVQFEKGVRASDFLLRPRFEIRGAFGGNADTLVVYDLEPTYDEWLGSEAIVAFAGDRIAGVVGDPPLFFSRHQLAGVTDLDGDAIQEVLWWGSAEDGFGLHLTWFAGGQWRRNRVFSCECAPDFADVYPLIRKDR